MFTTQDERKGLVKTDWNGIRDRVLQVEPEFAKMVDKLCPGEDFSLFVAYIPFGDLKGDTQSSLFPCIEGGHYRLTDSNVPKEITTELGYANDSAPLGLVLEKRLEFFWDLPDEGITIPRVIYKPGDFLSILTNIILQEKKSYTSNKIYSIISGARSIFSLPNIGCTHQHRRLQTDFNVKLPPPKSLYDQWSVFKEIYDSDVNPYDWRSCILYFSEKWINKLHNDPAWLPLKFYLYEKANSVFQYALSARLHYESAFSMIQKKRNLNPNPYLVDTAKHLFSIAIGDSPAYAPSCNEETIPLELLQQAYVETYGLKKYYPTFMQPQHFNFDEDRHPIYYSLQHPSTYIFSPNSCKSSSTLVGMREIDHIAKVFTEELCKENTPCSDTVLGEIAKKIQIYYYHTELDKHNILTHSSKITDHDPQLTSTHPKYKLESAVFAAESPFVRGCISIRNKFSI